MSSGKEEEFGEPFTEGDIIGCYAVSDIFKSSSICVLVNLTVVLLSCHIKI